MRRRACGCWLLLVALVGLILAPGALARTTTTYARAHNGTLVRVHARHRARAAANAVASASGIRGARRIPHSFSNVAAPLAAPQAGALALASAPPSLLANFNGVSSRDSAVTNFGAEFEPPDQGLCAGNGFVVEMVNSAYTVYKPNGTVVTGPFNVNGPFDEGLTEFTSDPRCQYDAATHTWFATILFISSDNTSSRLDIAVNTSGDPTKPWTTYQINTTDTGGKTGPKHPGCPCFGDQPLLGIDAFNVYVSTNEFSILGPQFNGAQIYAIAKSDLEQPGPPSSALARFVHFDKLNIGGAPAASVQPAITSGSPQAEFFLNSLDPTGTFDQRIGVWAMTNRARRRDGRQAHALEHSGHLRGLRRSRRARRRRARRSLLDAGDDRMQQAQFLGGDLWGALDTSVTIPNDPTARAGAAWFDVRPTVSGPNGVITSAPIHRQGYVAVPGNYLLYPAIQAAPSGRAAMVVTLSGQRHFPSAAYAVLPKGASAFGDVTIAADGTTNYDPDATRWGDYSWAILDPSGNVGLDGDRVHTAEGEPDPRRAAELGDPGAESVALGRRQAPAATGCRCRSES